MFTVNVFYSINPSFSILFKLVLLSKLKSNHQKVVQFPSNFHFHTSKSVQIPKGLEKMRDEEAPIATTITSSTATVIKKESVGSENGLFGKGKYKSWALAAIILLALWSMFTGSVTLKWSAGNLTRASDELDFHEDFDILEMEDQEKKVRQMWNIYTHSNNVRLPSFWQLAFKAAYEDLASEVPAIRDAALSEIAKMSLHNSHLYDLGLESPPVEPGSKKRSPIRKMKSKAS